MHPALIVSQINLTEARQIACHHFGRLTFTHIRLDDSFSANRSFTTHLPPSGFEGTGCPWQSTVTIFSVLVGNAALAVAYDRQL